MLWALKALKETFRGGAKATGKMMFLTSKKLIRKRDIG